MPRRKAIRRICELYGEEPSHASWVQLDSPRTARSHWGDRTVELSSSYCRLENRPRARCRQYVSDQARFPDTNNFAGTRKTCREGGISKRSSERGDGTRQGSGRSACFSWGCEHDLSDRKHRNGENPHESGDKKYETCASGTWGESAAGDFAGCGY